MGEVLLARDTRLGRLVAIKRIIQHGCDVQRFLAEAHVTVRLSHESIVIIHELGDHDGTPYMVLEYLRGKTLGEYLDDRQQRHRDEGAPCVGAWSSCLLGLRRARAARALVQKRGCDRRRSEVERR
jgi:serine/threonine protein kinase